MPVNWHLPEGMSWADYRIDGAIVDLFAGDFTSQNHLNRIKAALLNRKAYYLEQQETIRRIFPNSYLASGLVLLETNLKLSMIDDLIESLDSQIRTLLSQHPQPTRPAY